MRACYVCVVRCLCVALFVMLCMLFVCMVCLCVCRYLFCGVAFVWFCCFVTCACGCVRMHVFLFAVI